MKITRIKDGGIFVQVDRTEAMQLIKSLTAQILANSSNGERKESYSEEGDYFTIAVKPEETPKRPHGKLADIFALSPEKYIEKYGENWIEMPMEEKADG